MLNRVYTKSPGGDTSPGQFTQYFLDLAIQHKLPEINEHLKELVEITLNGLRDNLHFTSHKKKHIKVLTKNLSTFNEDLELASLDVFRASHYSNIEELDEELTIMLEVFNEIAMDARSNLTLLYMLSRKKLPKYLKCTTVEQINTYMLSKHLETVLDVGNDFIVNQDREHKWRDNSELN